MNNDYLLMKVSVQRSHVENVETAMLNCGAMSCTYQDATDTPIHEPAPGTTPLWPDVVVTGVFDKNANKELVTSLLTHQMEEFGATEISSEMLTDKDWERAWMDDFKPVEITSRLWIVPTFCEPPNPAAINISLDPGLAFGSGTHPTTHLCLQWLAKIDVKNKTVIDYGCGSGILAVAAVLLGAANVYAFDIEPQALLATAENAERNGVLEKVTICHSDRDLPAKVDIVVANILMAPLLELQARFCDLLSEEGQIGVSGVLSEQVGSLAAAYATQFRHSETEIREQWAMYTAIKQEVIST